MLKGKPKIQYHGEMESPQIDTVYSKADKRDILKCSKCSEFVSEPEVLDCLHVFCSKCLTGEANCFACKATYRKSEKVTVLLQKLLDAFLASRVKGCCQICGQENVLARCRDCKKNMCHCCNDTHSKFPLMKSHQVDSIENAYSCFEMDETVMCLDENCQRHDQAIFYCTKCKVLICNLCNGTIHKLHRCQSIHLAATTVARQVSKEVSSLKQLISERSAMQEKGETVKEQSLTEQETLLRQKHKAAVARVRELEVEIAEFDKKREELRKSRHESELEQMKAENSVQLVNTVASIAKSSSLVQIHKDYLCDLLAFAWNYANMTQNSSEEGNISNNVESNDSIGSSELIERTRSKSESSTELVDAVDVPDYQGM